MAKLKDHPTVKQFYNKQSAQESGTTTAVLDAEKLRRLCREFGADDIGFVEIDRPEIADQREDILAVFPRAKTLISIVCKMNREPIRSPARSIANIEFHHTGDHVNEVGRKIVAELEKLGFGGINPAMGFPMEMTEDRWPDKPWVVSHKPVAEAAGLGVMGIHRNVIHPKFGNFILLGTVITDAEVSEYARPLDYNPCLECKLCVAACPVGAVGADGHFAFSNCYTHNYREFMGGFSDWVENIADSRNAEKYRRKVSDAESVSMWQSLSFGPNYKAAYCLSVCPAGEDIIGGYLADKKTHLQKVVKPLQEKKEVIYVVPGSDAEEHVAKRFPAKTTKQVGNALRPNSIALFLKALPWIFQREKAKDLDATYHFTATGAENIKATIVIRHKTLQVSEGHLGKADLQIIADSRTWLKFLAKETHIAWALLRRKVKLKGSPKLLLAFGKCFP